MAEPANDNDFAYQPPSQFTAYGPPPVEKQGLPLASRLIQRGETMNKPVASGITKRIE